METLTWAEYFRLGEGYHRRTRARETAEWERIRWSTAWLINVQLDAKDRMAPEVMFPMDFDAPTAKALRTPETMEARLARLQLLDPDKFQTNG